MIYSVFILALVIVLTSAVPVDHVIAKLDSGLRYQYIIKPNGTPELVDLWKKVSDVKAAAEYNPDVDNKYYLFTRSNPKEGQLLRFGSESTLKESNYNDKRNTVILVHGWKNTPTSDFNVHLVEGYLIAEDVNVIVVDWSIGANMTYLSSMSNVFRSAEHVANFISWLNSVTYTALSQYHIIGHGLGGHQAGVIGRHHSGHVPYITALDLALPGWTMNYQAFSLSDGVYTEVIHTNADYFGYVKDVGDVDFYPNGGGNMPGCQDNDCNHNRSIFYMKESLISGGFVGHRCDNLESALSNSCTSADTLKMGGNKPKFGINGIFALSTNANSPFSQ